MRAGVSAVTLIRSMTHVDNISNHNDAMHHLLSGQINAPADSPYLGSIISRVRPNERNIANYVWLIRCVGDPVFCAPNIGSGGHLGNQYTPLFIGSTNNHPAMPSFVAPGMTALNPGRNSTSSNARPSGIEFGSTTAIAFIPRRIEGADGIKRHPPYGGAA